MKRLWLSGGLIALAMIVLGSAAAPAQEAVLEYEGVPTRDWPVDCSNWHELYPNFCLNHHQSGHEDNGDGVLSVCDIIVLDGVRFHIDWVGPTYWLDCNGDGVEDTGYEPLQWWPGNPVCQEWVQVWPVYGPISHVDGWQDGNGNDAVDECDMIQVGPTLCHVLRVGLNIHTTEDPTATEESTWSKVKSFFGGIF